MNDPFLENYRTLGIEPGCSLGQLKSAYRKLVKTWHPDRYPFPHQAGARATAEQRMGEINRAFRLLSEYHRRHGRLPTAGDTAFKVEEPVAAPPRQSNRQFETENGNDRVKRTPKAAGTRPLSFVLLGAGLGILWATWNAYQRNATTGEMTPPEASAPAAGINDASPPAVAVPSAPQNDSYFTFGSALGKVYAVQGVPTRTEDGVWYYGKSKVFFTDGAVSHWEEDPNNPLKTTPPAERSSPTLTTFGVGSTKDEVKAIQGNPLSENSTRWDYGLSQVFFQDGKVTGWYESPLTPLKVHK